MTAGVLCLLCWQPAAEAQVVKVRAAYPSVDIQYLPAYLAQMQGFFNDEGLEVELIVMRGARSGVQALVGGDVQFGLALGAALSAIWSGADLKIVAQMTNTLPFSLIVRPEIKRLEDLKGKKIGASVGSTTYALVYEVLKQNGIDPEKSVDYVNIPGAAPRLAALERGLIAATPIAAPADVRAIASGFKRLLFFGDVLPEMAFTGLVVSGRYLREHPTVVEKMVRAVVRGTDSARQDAAAATRAIEKYMKLAPDESRETYRVVQKSFNPILTESGVQKMAALVSGSTAVHPTKEPRDYMDMRFLNRALSEARRK